MAGICGYCVDSGLLRSGAHAFTAGDGGNRRMVTVLYPASGWGCPVEAVEASGDPADTRIELRMKDGSTVMLDEQTLKKETERP